MWPLSSHEPTLTYPTSSNVFPPYMMPENEMGEQLLNISRLENLTYPSSWLRDFNLDEAIPVTGFSSSSSHIRKSSKVDLGFLDVLPLELLHLLLSRLDVYTIMAFQRVNRRAMEVVESVPQYKAVITHAPNTLRGILSIETGRWTSCEALYEKLCTAECEQCGDFRGYLYILTCTRACFLCFSKDERYLPVRHSHAIRKFGISSQILPILPCMRSRQGTYSSNEMKYRERLALVDSGSAYQAGIAIHGSSSAMEQYASNLSTEKLQEFDGRAAQAAAEGPGSTTRRLSRPRTEDVFDGKSGNPLRFMAIFCMPWFNRISQDLEWGFHCIGCHKSHCNRPMHYRRKFAMESFSEHLRQCGNIRYGKHYLE